MAAEHGLNLRITADSSDASRGVREVATDVDALAKTLGGELGAKAQEAAAKLRALSEQEAAIKAFLNLQTQVGASERALKQLSGEADRYGAQITKSGPPTAQEAANLQRLRDAAAAVATGLQGQKEQLGASAAEMQRLGVATDGASRTLARIKGDIVDTAANAGQLDPRIAALTKDLTDAGAAADTAAQRHDALGRAFRNVATSIGALFAVSKLKQYAGDAIATADAYGQMAERIRMATASQAEYEQVQSRLQETANNTYRALSEQQEMYIRTADALKGLGYDTGAVLDITDSLSYLLTTNAASADKGRAAIDAYSKSIQSGKVDSQAWQTILAATPTIVDAIAQATGKTTEEIRQLGVQGKLSIASLNEGLRQSVDANKAATEGMVTTVADAMQRLSNTWSVYIGEANHASGATERIVELINTLTNNLDGVIGAAVKAGEVLAVMAGARALSALLAYTVQLGAAATGTVALAGATTGLGAALVRARAAMEGLAAASKGLVLAALAVEIANVGAALYKWKQAADAAAAAQGALDEKSAQLAARFADIARQTGVSVTSMRELDAAVAAGQLHFDAATQSWVAGAGAQQQLAQATGIAVKSAGEAALAWGALQESYAKVNDAVAAQVDLAGKQAEAARARGTAAVAEAKLLGDEAALRAAVSKAAADEAAALQDVAAKRQTQVDVLRAELDAKNAALAQSPVVTQAQRDEIAALQQLIEARELDADKARAQAATADANAKANSAEALAATAATEATRARAIARNADAQSAVSLLQTQKELAGQSEKLARLMGDESAAREFRIQQLQIDIQITNAKAEAMRAEANGSIEVARANLEELRVKGELTQVKQAELDASIKIAEAKLKEADAVRASTRVTQQAIENLKAFGDEAGKAGAAGEAAGHRVAAGWGVAAGSIREATAAQKEFAAEQDRKYGRAGQSESLSNLKSGAMSATQGVATWLSAYNQAKSYGLTEEEARSVAERAFPNGIYANALQEQMKRSTMDYMDVTEAVRRASEEIIREGGGQVAANAKKEEPTAATPTRPPVADSTSGMAAPTQYISNITIPGVASTTASFTDQASQNNVTALLQQLQTAKARAQ